MHAELRRKDDDYAMERKHGSTLEHFFFTILLLEPETLLSHLALYLQQLTPFSAHYSLFRLQEELVIA
jgi:hypothetical protein